MLAQFLYRHADLLATDISAELCIKYIDRFLMFYIATADRLQRTAAWMEKLEGGGCFSFVFLRFGVLIVLVGWLVSFRFVSLRVFWFLLRFVLIDL